MCDSNLVVTWKLVHFTHKDGVTAFYVTGRKTTEAPSIRLQDGKQSDTDTTLTHSIERLR